MRVREPRTARRAPGAALLASGLTVIGALVVLAAAAPWISPYDPAEQIDPEAGRLRPPGTVLAVIELEDGRRLLAERVEPSPGGLVVHRLGEERFFPASEVLNLTATGVADRRLFLLGSDRFGRDILSRTVHGARVSLTIGLLAVALASTVGVAVGGIAGGVGGPVDAILMRLVDACLAFPRLFLVLAVAALFGAGQWLVILVLGGTGWMGVSRLARGELLGLRRRDYVTAARGLGQRPLAIFFRHLLPNALTPLVVDATLRVGDIILVEAALSFLGLGVQPPVPSWGNMVADGRDVLFTSWWVTAVPGAAIALTVIGFNLLGDGLRQALDPRRRGEVAA